MYLVATGLTATQATKAIPIILRFVQDYLLRPEVIIEDYNNQILWKINDIEPISDRVKDFLVVELSQLYLFPDYFYIGDDPITEWLLYQKKIPFVIFRGLILSRENLSLGVEKQRLLADGFGWLKSWTLYIPQLGETVYIGQTGTVFKNSSVGGDLTQMYQTLLRSRY